MRPKRKLIGERRLPADAPSHVSVGRHILEVFPNLDPTDLNWLGESEADELPDQQLREIDRNLVDAELALRQILIPVIQSHPSKYDLSDQQRLDAAIALLLGRPARTGRDRDSMLDDVVRRVAEEYWLTFVGKRPQCSLAELIREAATTLGYDLSDPDRMESVTKVIRRRFVAEKDRLLREVSTRTNNERRRQSILVRRATASLSDLGLVERT